jgi:hypothetical protein
MTISILDSRVKRNNASLEHQQYNASVDINNSISIGHLCTINNLIKNLWASNFASIGVFERSPNSVLPVSVEPIYVFLDKLSPFMLACTRNINKCLLD